MKSKFIALVVILLFVLASAPDLAYSETTEEEYNTDYCHDPEELKRWQGIIDSNQNNDDVQGLHALWIGLCMKVDMRQLTVDRANEIFEKERARVINTFPKNNKSLL
ncbi:hypothetical protein KKI24_11655 [bacterium]|nr:hypothetical protein [bacterium]